MKPIAYFVACICFSFVGALRAQTQPSTDEAAPNLETDIKWTAHKDIDPSRFTGRPLQQVPYIEHRPVQIITGATPSFASVPGTLANLVASGDLDRLKSLVGEVKTKEQINFPYVGQTLLYIAADVGSLKAAEYLISQGADPDVASGTLRYTPLHRAVERGDETMVALLLKHRADPNLSTYWFELKPLHVAVQNNRVAIVKLLLEHQADPSLVDARGLTPLDQAIALHRSQIVEALLDHQLDSTIFGAAAQGNAVRLKQLLAMNPKLSVAVDPAGRTPLHEAARLGWVDACQLLIGFQGVQLNAVDARGQTPLQLASQAGYPQVVNALLGAGANVNTVDSKSHSSLDLARGDEIRQTLKRAGARPGFELASAAGK